LSLFGRKFMFQKVKLFMQFGILLLNRLKSVLQSGNLIPEPFQLLVRRD
jgi:hypothetical protein